MATHPLQWVCGPILLLFWSVVLFVWAQGYMGSHIEVTEVLGLDPRVWSWVAVHVGIFIGSLIHGLVGIKKQEAVPKEQLMLLFWCCGTVCNEGLTIYYHTPTAVGVWYHVLSIIMFWFMFIFMGSSWVSYGSLVRGGDDNLE
ncbi:hypothetical protein BS47DRAFT_1366724 [Hydnum rufescens UP504]|uniref:Uncharacterized protein n=1 Tax=Hydnum rufescens UP504 TaxID=1448309 RepID=A0A9P6AKA2_9AGAM|nr:hypothetical protein BS47DRAFT_1366724 [Hydnum rufescens UP504]